MLKNLKERVDRHMPHVSQINVAVSGFSRGGAQARSFVRHLADQSQRQVDDLIWKSSDDGGHAEWASELRIPSCVRRCIHHVAAHEVREKFDSGKLSGKRDQPRNGELVTAKNTPHLTDVAADARYLAVHIYPDESVELITLRHYPEATARGEMLAAAPR